LIVVDTSVVVKWAIEEDGAEAARRLISEQLFAPDLIIFELGHVLTKKVRRHELDRGDATTAYTQLPLLLELVPSRPHERRAFDLAIELHHAIYDCYFLALAEVAECELVTADAIFARKVREMHANSQIQLLSESAS
jgi:predicted nucleic acid-binding protein